MTHSAEQLFLLLAMTTSCGTIPADPTNLSPALTPGQLSQVLGAVKDCLQDEIQSLKRELYSQEREVADDRLSEEDALGERPYFQEEVS